MDRISKEEYYLDIAKSVSARSTCLRRAYGAVIVSGDRIVSTGYNGAPEGRKNCTDMNVCLRNKLKIPSGERYELCRSVHAEANAIISASKLETCGATLYLSGTDVPSGDLLPISEPCAMCKRMIINAKITEVISRGPGGEVRRKLVRDWVFDDDSLPEKVKS